MFGSAEVEPSCLRGNDEPKQSYGFPESRVPSPDHTKSNSELDCSRMKAFCAACNAVLSRVKRLIASA